MSIRFLWNATRGHRLTPWRSEYLKWRIETYSGRKADTIDAGYFWMFCVEGKGPTDALSRLDEEFPHPERSKLLKPVSGRSLCLLLAIMFPLGFPAQGLQASSPQTTIRVQSSEVLVPTLVQMPSGEIIYGLGTERLRIAGQRRAAATSPRRRSGQRTGLRSCRSRERTHGCAGI